MTVQTTHTTGALAPQQQAGWTSNAAYQKTPADMLWARAASRVVEDWREEYDRHDPQLECPVCVADWACEETEPYPCPTARALGVRVPSETTGDPA